MSPWHVDFIMAVFPLVSSASSVGQVKKSSQHLCTFYQLLKV